MVKQTSASGRMRRLVLTAAVFLASVWPQGWLQPVQAATADHVVISEVYGGGGNSGATYKNDFIELYNPTGQAVSIDGWTVQYASAGGSSWQKTVLAGSIPAYGYYLIQQASGAGGTVDLPLPDAQGSIAMGASAGKVALVSNGNTLSGTDPAGQAGVVDFVGYGANANAAEGGAPAPAPSATNGISRKSNESGIVEGEGNGWDTDNNGADFLTAALTPRSTGDEGGGGDPGNPGDLTPVPIAAARVEPNGTAVFVEGIVTAILEAGGKNNVYVQDDTAGIVVRAADLAGKLAPGDKIRATGTVNQYYGLAQLEANTADVLVIQPQAGVPAPQLVTSHDFSADKGESLEAELVTLSNVTVESVASGNYTLRDDSGTFVSRPSASLPLSVGTTYESMTGVVTYDFNVYKLVPRSSADMVVDSTKVPAVSANPPGPMVAAGTKVTLATALADATIHYTTDGSEPTRESQVYTEPIQVDAPVTIKAFAVKDGYKDSDIAVFSYTIQKDDIRIHDIQGTAHDSSYENAGVEGVEGIVTAVVRNNGSVHGFFMQDPQPDADPRTSEGIYVYEPRASVTPGDLVTVSGIVKEYVTSSRADTDLTQTQIDAASYTVVSQGNPLPQPLVLGEGEYAYPKGVIDDDSFAEFDPEADGIDFWESVEGMLVQVNHPVVVGERRTFTNPPSVEFVIIDDEAHPEQPRTPAGGVLLQEDDAHPERITVADKLVPITAAPKVGDRLSAPLAGIVDYSFTNYKLYPIEPFEVVESEYAPTVTKFEQKDDELTIATYNIENFSAASDPAKIARLAETIVHNLNEPDIIGVVEMQDNDGATDSGVTDAGESARVLIEAIKDESGPVYRYVDIAPENKEDGGQPGGNIRVGFFYNPDRVELADGTSGDAVTAVQVETVEGVAHLSLNPGRVDPLNEAFVDSRKPLAAEFVFKGKPVIVIANHFNSKGGDGGLYGKQQPPELVSEEQRMEIARVLNAFVKEIHDADPQANVIVLGDLNDFPFSRPIQALQDGVLTNMVDELPEEERYTYVYQGNSQTLDQILVSRHLADDTEIDIVRLNAGFTEEQGRVSDHDPVLVQIAVPERSQAEPTAEEVAAGITAVEELAADATRLKLPQVPDGFSIAIKTSSNPEVIALDGTIVPPASQTEVELVFTVTRLSDGSAAETSPIVVSVPAKTAEPPGEPTPEGQRELNEREADAIQDAASEKEIIERATSVWDSLNQLVTAADVDVQDKWETVQHTIETVLAAVAEQTDNRVVTQRTLAELTADFLDKAFAAMLEEEGADTGQLARQGLQALASLADTVFGELGKKQITDELAERFGSAAETLLQKAGTLEAEPGDEIQANDREVREIVEALASFMEAVGKANERIGIEARLTIQIAEEEEYGRFAEKKKKKLDPLISMDTKLVDQLRKYDIAVRMTVPSGAWVELPIDFLNKYRGKPLGLSLLPAEERVKNVPHPGDPYALRVWAKGKELNSFGNEAVMLGLPVSSEAGSKLQAYMYRGKSWVALDKGKGKNSRLTEEDGFAEFAVYFSASYVVGEVSGRSKGKQDISVEEQTAGTDEQAADNTADGATDDTADETVDEATDEPAVDESADEATDTSTDLASPGKQKK